MDKKIEEILSELNKTELAFFAKYRLLSYPIDTQKAIEQWIQQEGLTDKEIKKLIRKNEFPNRSKLNNNQYIRCRSKKLLNVQKETSTFSHSELFNRNSTPFHFSEVSMIVCSVCSFDQKKDHVPSFFLKILNTLFGRNKMKILP